MNIGRGELARQRFKQLEEARQEQFETEFQDGQESIDDNQEMEQDIIRFLSKGMRG